MKTTTVYALYVIGGVLLALVPGWGSLAGAACAAAGVAFAYAWRV